MKGWLEELHHFHIPSSLQALIFFFGLGAKVSWYQKNHRSCFISLLSQATRISGIWTKRPRSWSTFETLSEAPNKESLSYIITTFWNCPKMQTEKAMSFCFSFLVLFTTWNLPGRWPVRTWRSALVVEYHKYWTSGYHESQAPRRSFTHHHCGCSASVPPQGAQLCPVFRVLSYTLASLSGCSEKFP